MQTNAKMLFIVEGEGTYSWGDYHIEACSRGFQCFRKDIMFGPVFSELDGAMKYCYFTERNKF